MKTRGGWLPVFIFLYTPEAIYEIENVYYLISVALRIIIGNMKGKPFGEWNVTKERNGV